MSAASLTGESVHASSVLSEGYLCVQAPRDKLVCILNCCRYINTLLKNAREGQSSGERLGLLLDCNSAWFAESAQRRAPLNRAETVHDRRTSSYPRALQAGANKFCVVIKTGVPHLSDMSKLVLLTAEQALRLWCRCGRVPAGADPGCD